MRFLEFLGFILCGTPLFGIVPGMIVLGLAFLKTGDLIVWCKERWKR